MLYVAWLGDSQVMLVRRGQAVELMKPHKPDREVRTGWTAAHRVQWSQRNESYYYPLTIPSALAPVVTSIVQPVVAILGGNPLWR